MKVEVDTPDEVMGDVIGDLSSKRGMISGNEALNNYVTVKAFVPLSEMFGYVTNLRGMSQGRASFSMEPDHYEVVPTNLAEKLKV